MNIIRNPEALDNAMTRKFGEFWFLQESFKATYGKNQLIEKIVVLRILLEFKQISAHPHYARSTRAKLGLLGELLVKNIVGGILSDDLYDTEKDVTLIENGDTIEVKVATFFHKTNEFQIMDNATQTTIRKLTNVDHVYYIERRKSTIVLYRNTKNNYRYCRNWNCVYAPIDDFEEVEVLRDKSVHSLFLKLSDHRFDKKYMRN